MTSDGRLECRVIIPPGQDQQNALVDQLSLVRRLIGAASGVRMIFTSDRGYFAQAAAGGLRWTSASSAPEPSQTQRRFVSSPWMAASSSSCHPATPPPRAVDHRGQNGATEAPASTSPDIAAPGGDSAN